LTGIQSNIELEQGALHARAERDPRVLMSQVERGAQAVASGAAGAPPWVVLAAFLASDAVGHFGRANLGQALTAMALVLSASLFVRFGFVRFMRVAQGNVDLDIARTWFRRVLALNILMSCSWGLVPWLLWQPGNLANHLFLALISITVVGRFLVSRGGHMAFFAASFGPMAILLLARFLTEGAPPNLLLALLLPVYALHVALDVRRHSLRMDSDVELRFANEDLARALEGARDEALKKRREAENANASKTTFLANMSHELRTPLNAILGFSEIIARECLGPIGSPRYKEYASDIHASGAHLLSLINELLDVAKIEAGRMEIEPAPIDTKRLLEGTL
jgi:two-component system cell cycle sensor histidine kinase PleC